MYVRVHSIYSFLLSLSLSRPIKSADNWNDNDYDVTDVTIMAQQIHADRWRPARLAGYSPDLWERVHCQWAYDDTSRNDTTSFINVD